MFVSVIGCFQVLVLFAIIAAVVGPGMFWLLKWDKQRLAKKAARKAAKKTNNK